MKPRLAFVDHSFHQKTRSSDFIKEILKQTFTVVEIWNHNWKGENNITAAELNVGQFAYIFFWQSLLPVSELRQLQSRLIWAPMYDSVYWQDPGYWLELRTLPLKIICFSQTLFNALQRYQFDCLAVHYSLDPATLPQVQDYSTVRVFFWQRTDLTFTEVKQLLGETAVARWVIKLDADPNFSQLRPSPQEIEQYNITLIEGSMTRRDYIDLLGQCNVFICPRRYEGIGMSFLEAMAMGLVPIALDHPTMNEYITDGHNGRLWRRPTALALTNLSELGHNAKSSLQQCYSSWQKQQGELITFIQQPPQPVRQTRWFDPLRYRLWYWIHLGRRIYRRFCTAD